MGYEQRRSVLDGRLASNHGRATPMLNYAYGDHSRPVAFSSEFLRVYVSNDDDGRYNNDVVEGNDNDVDYDHTCVYIIKLTYKYMYM